MDDLLKIYVMEYYQCTSNMAELIIFEAQNNDGINDLIATITTTPKIECEVQYGIR